MSDLKNMRNYTIVKTNGAPDWSTVKSLGIDNLLWAENVDISAVAKIAYDAENLYVYLAAKEKDIRAEYTSQTGMPCEDSCLEFFFAPDPSDTRYFNFEFNPNGASYVGFGHGRDDVVRLLPDVSAFEPQPRRVDGGWEITYRIPLSFLRVFLPNASFSSGQSMRANCYKCGDLTPRVHYLAWNPVASDTPEFHSPSDFGMMRFE